MPSGPVAAAIVLAIAVVIGGIYLFLELRHHGGRSRDRHRASERLPLFGTDLLVDRGGGSDRPLPRNVYTAPAPPPMANGHAPMAGAPLPPPPSREAPPNGHRPTPPAARPVMDRDERAAAQLGAFDAPPRPAERRAGFGAPDGGTLVEARTAAPARPGFHDGETIRFSIPDEGTLQFLPGRLEVVGGTDRGREVRFVRTPGESRPEVTFGRSEGPDYRHVQLLARTVSRHHATMSLIDGHWQLTNVSATNPVLLNGRSLAAGEVAPLLVDGDRIEMGEVVFVFHER